MVGIDLGDLRLINPALNARIDWIWFIASQIAFGMTTGYVVHIQKWCKTMQTWPLAARAGIEAPGVISEEREAVDEIEIMEYWNNRLTKTFSESFD